MPLSARVRLACSTAISPSVCPGLRNDTRVDVTIRLSGILNFCTETVLAAATAPDRKAGKVSVRN